MKLQREYHFDPVLKHPLKVILERDFLWVEVYYQNKLLHKANKQELKKGFQFEEEGIGEIYLKRTRKKPPGFEVKVNGYYAQESENHPYQRMRSTAIFYGVITFLGATNNLSLEVCFLSGYFKWSLLFVFFISAVALMFKQIWVIPITGVLFILQQIACFNSMHFESSWHFYLQMIFNAIFLIWSIREIKTIKETYRHNSQSIKYEDANVLDV